MRVLMTCDAVGGVWTYALELADALAPHGVDTVLATMGPRPSPAQRDELAASAVTELHESDYALEWEDDPWDDVARAGDWLLELAADLEPDVIHLNGYAHAALPWERPVLVAGHSCVLSWWSAVHSEPAPARYEPYAAAVRDGVAAADLLVAPTRAFLAELERLYAPECERLVVPNGRRARAVRAKEPFVLAAGRLWDPAKNLAALDAAAARVDWPVIACGPCDVRHEPRHVRSAGAVSRRVLDDLLGRAWIFAAPARYEPFGLGVLEAATAGCALVLGDIPSFRELWDGAACFVSPGDHQALADVLATLIEDGELRAELGRGARRRAATYTPQRMAERYLEAYHRTAEGATGDAGETAEVAA